MSTPSRLPLPVLLVSVLFLTACSEDRTVEGPPDEGQVGAACETDADCQTEWCLKDPSFPGNYCSKQCESEADCPDGTYCHDYLTYKFCLDACNSDEECRESYVCDYGSCRPPCNNDRACREGDLCLENRCQGKCTQPSDCPDGMRCQDGRCVPPCQSDAECLPGFGCDKGSGQCAAKPGKKMGEPCKTSQECATDYCLPTRKICSVKCTSNARCPSGYVCGLEKFDKDNNGTLDDVEADCVPVKGKGAVGSTCAADDHCASGHCYNGFCMEACASDADCDKNAQCLDVNIVLKAAIPKYKGCLPRVGTSEFTLGTFTSSSTKGVDIPANASSFVLLTEMNTLTEIAAIFKLTDPNNAVLFEPVPPLDCTLYSQPIRYHYGEQVSSMYVPNTPAVKLVPGVYAYDVSSTDGKPITVKVQLKLGKASKGTLNLNWFFLNLAGTCVPGSTLNAASAKTHPWLTKLRDNMTFILKKANLTIGVETFHDLSDPGLDNLDLGGSGVSTELQKLFSHSKSMQGKAINIFLVRKITATSGMMGGIVLGISGGIPGPPGRHGTVHSGVAMSMETACYEQYGYNPGHTMAHEIAHYLGLFHNQEQPEVPGLYNNQVICPCPCGKNMTCIKQWTTSWCRAGDPIPDTADSPDNLMFFAAESTNNFKGNQLTAGQIRVMLDNPVVGH